MRPELEAALSAPVGVETATSAAAPSARAARSVPESTFAEIFYLNLDPVAVLRIRINLNPDPDPAFYLNPDPDPGCKS